MTQSPQEGRRPENSHKAYHAHVYFDRATRRIARQLCDLSAQRFGLRVGTFHQKLVGPHPCWSCQITFAARDFDEFIPWLEANRQGLTVFVHALTGDDWKDHTDFAYWLGPPVALNLDFFPDAAGSAR